MNQVTELFLSYLDLKLDKSLHEIVYDAFYKMIITGKIPAGTRINEKQISIHSNISRTPIRQALKQLEAEKLIAYGLGNKNGAIVLGITRKDVYEIFTIRRSFETFAVIEASRRMSKEDFSKLHQLVQKSYDLYELDDFAGIRDNFRDFNAFIFERAKIFRIQNILETLEVYQLYFYEITTKCSERTLEVIKNHEKIYALMLDGDEKGLERIIDDYLKVSSEFIANVIDEKDIKRI
ncbi:GntR family transcriptional regulator [Streptococcaceae bacterium ESL0729]|nr:GntR family transcriptional regulator [Streptococcaceae bacterium ESL0729]